MAEEKPKPRFKRRPLGRTLGKRRGLGKKQDQDEAADAEAPAEDEGAEDEESDATEVAPRALPNRPAPVKPAAPEPSGPTRAEKRALRRAAFARLMRELSAFSVEFGRWVTSGGKRSWRQVGLPFSKALVDAAISMCLILVTLLLGMVLGGYLHPVLAPPSAPSASASRPSGRGMPFPVQRSRSAASPSAASGARAALTRFLGSIDNHAYADAYGLLSSAWQAELPYSTFQRGFAHTDSLNYRVDKTVLLGEGRVRFQVHLEVSEGGRTRSYAGTYVAVRTARGWRLDSGNFH